MAELIHEFKEYINKRDVAGFTAALTELKGYDMSDVPLDYVFQKVYLHACLKKRVVIVALLMNLYKELDSIIQIAIRQVFPYGRYLLAK